MRTVSPVVMESSSGRVGMNVHLTNASEGPGAAERPIATAWEASFPGMRDGGGGATLLYDMGGGGGRS